MMWNWDYGWGMSAVGLLMMLVFWGGILALAIVLVRSIAGPKSEGPDTALETLRRRLATGEITSEEYERVRKLLQG